MDAGTFGVLLKRYWTAAGLTQEGLAEQAGLNECVIRGLERGWRHRPRRDTARLLAALRLSGSERAAFEDAARRSTPTPPTPLLAPGTSLALAMTPLIGRSALVASAVALLRRRGTRLLTLIGPGGVGKTRLAVRVAERVRADYDDGVAMVSLASIGDPTLVAPTIAHALGLRDTGNRAPEDGLVTALREKSMLLVLDNVEQVKAAAPLLVALLAACPRLTLLVISRAALHVRAEQELAVPPLDTPDPAAPARGDASARSPAVALFVQRARAVDPAFRLTEANAATVAAICRQVDGLPLAIELAAARVKLLPPHALLTRLTPRLPVLTGGGLDRPERQRTMRDTIAWSYELLGAEEQSLCRRLAVFAGGCALEAAEAVCAGPAPRSTDPVAVLDGLAALVDASLVWQRVGPDGEPRIGMLGTIREYAAERLAARGQAAVIRRRHAAYYLAWAEATAGRMDDSARGAPLDRLEREHDNLRATLHWTRESGDAGAGLRLAGLLSRFWWIRGYLSEGRAWLDAALEAARHAAPPVPAAVRADALRGAGALAYSQRDDARALMLLEESRALSREIDDRRGVAAALGGLAGVLRKQGDDERAAPLAQESLALSREVGDRAGVALALANLGHIARHRGDEAGATALYGESLTVYRTLDDSRGIAYMRANLGLMARRRGAWADAVRLYEESLTLYDGLGDKGGRAFVLLGLGDVARERGDDARAAVLYDESLALHRALGDASGVARAHERLTTVRR